MAIVIKKVANKPTESVKMRKEIKTEIVETIPPTIKTHNGFLRASLIVTSLCKTILINFLILKI